MTNTLLNAQGVVLLLVGVAVLGLSVWALVNAVRFKAPAYVAASKQTKPLWVALTAVATALAFIAVFNPIQLPGILAAACSIYFLAGVRPAVAAASGGPRRNEGPYGSW